MSIILSKKPPIGIAPRWIVTEKRIANIKEAVSNYMLANMKIPIEWITEYNDLLIWLQRHKTEVSND